MLEITMTELKKTYREAIIDGSKYMALRIHSTELRNDEIIVNSMNDHRNKLDYISSTYTEDLQHKFSGGKISIVGFTHGDNLEKMKHDLLGGDFSDHCMCDNNYSTILNNKYDKSHMVDMKMTFDKDKGKFIFEYIEKENGEPVAPIVFDFKPKYCPMCGRFID